MGGETLSLEMQTTESAARPRLRSRDHPTRRSGTFWILLLILDAAAIIAVALATGQNQADPKRTVTAVFGLVGLYFVIFFTVKRREIARGEVADIRGAIRGVEIAHSDPALTDPTELTDSELYGAMAIKPVDAKALQARKRVWEFERKGTQTGSVIVVLIFVSVPPIYYFHTFVPTLVGAILIGTIGVYKSWGLMGQRLGGLYELSDEVMAPIGLKVTERYTVSIEAMGARPGGGLQAVTRGALELQGNRHGRHIKIRTPATTGLRSERTVEVTTPSKASFKFQAHDGRVQIVGNAPAPSGQLASQLPPSDRWEGVGGQVGGGLITIKRKSVKRSDPLLDLWLGERIADLLASLMTPSQADAD